MLYFRMVIDADMGLLEDIERAFGFRGALLRDSILFSQNSR